MSAAGAGDDRVQWLTDVEELRALTQRYARAVDERDFDALASIFHPDGVVEGMRGTSPVPEYLAAMRDAPRTFATSMHVLGDPLVDLEPRADEGRLDTYAVVHQLRAPVTTATTWCSACATSTTSCATTVAGSSGTGAR